MLIVMNFMHNGSIMVYERSEYNYVNLFGMNVMFDLKSTLRQTNSMVGLIPTVKGLTSVRKTW